MRGEGAGVLLQVQREASGRGAPGQSPRCELAAGIVNAAGLDEGDRWEGSECAGRPWTTRGSIRPTPGQERSDLDARRLSAGSHRPA